MAKRLKMPLLRNSQFGGLLMLSLVAGLAVAGAGGFGPWYFMPRHGQIHRLANVPFLDSLIPIGIVSAIAVGCALIVAGVMN